MRYAESQFAHSRARRAVAAGIALLLTCASVALGTSPASADIVHGPDVRMFGQGGKDNSTFGSLQVAGAAYDQARKRLYVLAHGALYAYAHPSIGVTTPLPAPFPLLEISTFNGRDMAVDNRTGPDNGNLYLGSGSTVEGLNSSGEPLPGFEGEQFRLGSNSNGLALDSSGQFFLGQYGEPPIGREQVGVWGSGGGSQIGTISTEATVGEVVGVAIDPDNDDLWVTGLISDKIAHYTEASGYSSFTTLPAPGTSSALAINSARNVLYAASGPFSGKDRVNSYDIATGELLESFVLPGGAFSIAVDESTDTLFITNYADKVWELRALHVPKATTGEPIADATVSGTADPDGVGSITECFFEFGVTDSYGSTQPCDQALPITSPTQVTATLPGLTVETAYHYRLVLANANGQRTGKDRTITSHHVNGLRTEPATGPGRTQVTLNGSYEGTGKETHYHFEWGLAGQPYEHSTPDEIKPAGMGSTPLAFPLEGLAAGTTYHYRVVASNELGSSAAEDATFTTLPAVKDLATESPTDVTTTEATLRGTLDPDGVATTYYFQYGVSSSYGLTVPAPPGQPVGTIAPGATQVGTEVTGLKPGTTYHYRIIAVNTFGTTVATDDRTVTTAQPPSITSFASRSVTPDSAELVAEINPNNAETTYRFEYGTTLAYGSVLPVPDGVLPNGSTEEEVAVQLTGLEPKTYHFRVVAESKWGTSTTGDQTFEYFPPQCPNAALREQTGATYLPDCRAYELVSPLSAGNVLLGARAPFAPTATSPARLAFTGNFGGIEGTGEPQVNLSDLYVATRSPEGWATKHVGLPATLASASSGPPNEPNARSDLRNIRVSADLSRILVWTPPDQFAIRGPRGGSFAPYVRTADGGFLGRLPSNLADVPGAELDVLDGGFVGDVEVSKDFSHFVFSSRNMAFTEGGLSTAPGSVYSNDIETGAVTLISKTPQGTDIPQDTGDAQEYIEIAGLSADGSRVLMSTKGAGGATHLYMAVNENAFYDVSKGDDGQNHAVAYVGMTENGSKVYFTSKEQLTADDHDNGTDLFMWEEGLPATVTRVSTGSGGTGDSDSCPATWTAGCGIATISTGVRSDNTIAARGGDIYFYSPELLDGAQGSLGDRNLYVFSGSEADYVATLPGSAIVNRIQVSPDGDHMALITRAKLSSSLTGGHQEMYSFDPGSENFRCVSCMTNGELPQHDVEGSQNGLFMSDDGRTFFSTEDSLIPQDTDGLRDSYEFVDSRPQLLTTGTADRDENTGFVGVSSDGVNAYFSTLETLVPQDDIGPFLKFYVARTGGGIPFERVAAPCAAADECHGPASGAPPKLPGTTGASLGDGGNLRPNSRPHRKKKAKKKKKRSRTKKGGKHHKQRSHQANKKGAQRG